MLSLPWSTVVNKTDTVLSPKVVASAGRHALRKEVPVISARACRESLRSERAGHGARRQQRERPQGSLSADIRQTPAE